jgi:hypothetical protein
MRWPAWRSAREWDLRTQTTAMVFQMRETESPRSAGARTRPMFLDSMPLGER